MGTIIVKVFRGDDPDASAVYYRVDVEKPELYNPGDKVLLSFPTGDPQKAVVSGGPMAGNQTAAYILHGTVFPTGVEDGTLFANDETHILYRYNSATSSWVIVGSLNLTDIQGNVTNITDSPVPAPSFTATAQGINTTTEFRTWIQIAITRIPNAGGYIIAYKRNTDDDTGWVTKTIEQTTGATATTSTTDLFANTLYNIRCASLSKLGAKSDWSAIQNVTTLTNSVGPITPDSAVQAINFVGCILLSWSYPPTGQTVKDLFDYEIYMSLTNNSIGATKIGESATPYYTYTPPTDSHTYETHYFWIKAVDTGGSKSGFSPNMSTGAVATKVDNPDIAYDAIHAEQILNATVQEAKLALLSVSWTKLSQNMQDTIGHERWTYFLEAEDPRILKAAMGDPNTTIEDDATASAASGTPIGKMIQRLSTAPDNTMWYGPYTTIPGGNYWALYRLKVTNNSSSDIFLRVDAYCARGGGYTLLGYKDLHPNDFAAPNTWQIFAVPVEIRNNDTLIELRGMGFIHGKTTVCCDWVALIPMSKISTDVIDAYAITASKIAAGAITANKLFIGIIVIDGLSFWYNGSGDLCWSDCYLYYQGAEYHIAPNPYGLPPDYPYIYWGIGDLGLSGGDTKPTDPESYFMIAVQKAGVCYPVWNATIIHGGSIITGSITGEEIDVGSIIIRNSAQIAGTVQILPNQVIIDGAVTLYNWRKTGDVTKIDGGQISTGSVIGSAIYANTITANKLKPGTQQAMTNILMSTFGYNGVAWTSGYVKLIDGTSYHLITSGNRTSLSGTNYFYISTTDSPITIHNTIDYSAVLSDTTILLFVVIVSADTTQTGPTIIPMLGGALYICADAIEANSIKGVHVQAGTLTTSKIAFDLLSTDPTYVAGLLWYRTDTDQLRFSKGTTIDDVTVIPKTPMSGTSSPAENLVPNAGFEDNKGDNTPLNWLYYPFSGAGSIIQYSTTKKSGGYSCKVSANASSEIAALSDFIPVDPSKTYYFETYSMPSLNDAHTWVEVFVYGYADKISGSLGNKSTSHNNRDSTNWTKDSFTTTPATDTDFGVNRANIRYIRIGLYCKTDAAGARYALFDSVIWSLQRATISAGGTVNDVIFVVPAFATIPSGVFTDTQLISSTYLINDADYTFITFQVYNPSLADGFAQWVFRIHDDTNNAYSGRVIWAPRSTSDSTVLVIAIPWNVNAHNLHIQVYQSSGSSKTIYVGPLSWYGFSPHTHT